MKPTDTIEITPSEPGTASMFPISTEDQNSTIADSESDSKFKNTDAPKTNLGIQSDEIRPLEEDATPPEPTPGIQELETIMPTVEPESNLQTTNTSNNLEETIPAAPLEPVSNLEVNLPSEAVKFSNEGTMQPETSPGSQQVETTIPTQALEPVSNLEASNTSIVTIPQPETMALITPSVVVPVSSTKLQEVMDNQEAQTELSSASSTTSPASEIQPTIEEQQTKPTLSHSENEPQAGSIDSKQKEADQKEEGPNSELDSIIQQVQDFKFNPTAQEEIATQQNEEEIPINPKEIQIVAVDAEAEFEEDNSFEQETDISEEGFQTDTEPRLQTEIPGDVLKGAIYF